MSNWHVRIGGKLVGIFTTDNLKQAVQGGQVSKDAEIATSESGPWQSITRVKGLEWPAVDLPPELPETGQPQLQQADRTEELLEEIALSLRMMTEHDTHAGLSLSQIAAGVVMVFFLLVAAVSPPEIRVVALLFYIGLCATAMTISKVLHFPTTPVRQFQERARKERRIKEQMERARAAGKAFASYTKSRDS